MTLKDQLKRDLKIHRYNLGHLAEIAEVHRSQISQYLNGNHTPTKRVAADLARAATELTGVNYRSSHFIHNSTLED
jgi:transcriptional regulator with XRE-family HTH domain